MQLIDMKEFTIVILCVAKFDIRLQLIIIDFLCLPCLVITKIYF